MSEIIPDLGDRAWEFPPWTEMILRYELASSGNNFRKKRGNDEELDLFRERLRKYQEAKEICANLLADFEEDSSMEVADNQGEKIRTGIC